MTVINDPSNAFDFAYAGFQYPLPKDWHYIVREQDQLQWLLQALLMLNDKAVGDDELAKDLSVLEQRILSLVQAKIAELDARISEIEQGRVRYRNPVTGGYDYGYTIAYQLYGMARPYAMTYDEIKALGLTYDQLKALGHTYYEIDMFANALLGNGKMRVMFTPTTEIDDVQTVYTPSGDTPAPVYNLGKGTTYDDLLLHGFAYFKGA